MSNQQNKRQRIIVAPLNWGLGHATRCIPIIRNLESLSVEPIIASDGRSLVLLKKEFPHLRFAELPSYRISYGKANMAWQIARQLPKIGRAVWREHRTIQRLAKQNDAAAIISDNRYGCYHPTLPTVMISHQLQIQTPSPLLSRPVNVLNHFFLRRFRECWVPDWPGSINLSGVLSHPAPKGLAVHYLGPLTRMKTQDVAEIHDWVAILSGPEPQRSFLEDKLMTQLKEIPGKKVIVLGKPELGVQRWQEDGLEVISFCTSEQLNELLAQAKFVICRSGYSSLMDLVKLQKPALLIPTPGQTEQEYLAKQFYRNGWMYFARQNYLDLGKDLSIAQNYPGVSHTKPDNLMIFLQDWLERITSY